MSATNPHVDKTHGSTTAEGVSTDDNGDVVVDVSELRAIESVADVEASAVGGYVASPQSVNGNSVTVRLFQGGGADSELSAVASSDGVTDVHVNAVGY